MTTTRTELHETRLEAIVSSIFYALNKRLPTTHYIDVERSISLVTNWLDMLMTGEEKLDKILYRIILNSGKNLLVQFISKHVLTCRFTLLFCVDRYS